MRIGELARKTGLSTHALRFYEQQGLITPQRRANGYRDYPSEAVEIVNLIRFARKLGFTLREIAAEFSAETGPIGPDRLREIFLGKIESIDRRMVELAHIRAELTKMMERTCPLTIKR